MNGLLCMGIILVSDLLAGLYYRKAFRTISFKMILEHAALAAVLMTALVLIPTVPPEAVMFLEAVLIYYDYEQLHTGHTILNVWDRRFILGIVMVWMLLFMGLGITGSVLGSSVLVRLLYLILAFGDRFVKKARGTDIELSDFEENALRTAVTVSRGYKRKWDSANVAILVLSFIQVALIYGLFGGLSPIAAHGAGYTAVSGGLLAKPVYYVSFSTMDRLLYFCIGLGGLVLIVHSPVLTLLKIDYYEFVNIDGVFPNLLLEGRSRLMDRVPAGYSEERVKEIVRKYKGDAAGFADTGKSPDGDVLEGSKPDIIVIMNESFADLRVLGKYEVSRPVMPFYDSLKADPSVLTGFVHVSVLGGNTAYSEYEFLTGDSTRFYRHCPYSSKIMSPGLTIHALPSHLKDLGYRTVATHSYLRENWRRPIVYGNLGFEEQYYIDDFPQDNIEKVRSFCSDSSHYREVIRRMEEAEDDRPLFMFNITMQNHGGYAPDAFLPDRIIVSTGGSDLSGGVKTGTSAVSPGSDLRFPEAGTFETLMNISDSAIPVLTDYLSTRERPAVLLFFGDHQPKFSEGFLEGVLGHPESVMTEEERNRLYMTPYFIWSNRPLNLNSQINDISLNYMGGYLLRLANLPLTGYMRYLEDQMKKQPVFTRRVGSVPSDCESLIYCHIRGGEAGAEGFF